MQEIASKKEIGKRLKALRLENSLSQEETAKIIGTSRSNYSQIELGKQFPTYDALYHIMRYFNKSYQWILHGEVKLDESYLFQDHSVKVKSSITKKNNNNHNHPFISLVSSHTQSDYLKNYGNLDFINKLPQICFPMKKFRDPIRAFEVNEVIKEFGFYPGDIIIGSKVEDYKKLNNNGIYLMIANCFMYINKVICVYPEVNSILLTTRNNQDPLLLNHEEIQEIWMIRSRYSSVLDIEKDKLEFHLDQYSKTVTEIKFEIAKIRKMMVDKVKD
ncbi:MAG: helix-turn-helix transcriptional regulator [Pelobium sp.]